MFEIKWQNHEHFAKQINLLNLRLNMHYKMFFSEACMLLLSTYRLMPVHKNLNLKVECPKLLHMSALSVLLGHYLLSNSSITCLITHTHFFSQDNTPISIKTTDR